MELKPLQDVVVSDYRISTITMTGNINSIIELPSLYNFIDVDKYETIRYVEYGSTKTNQCFKGYKESKTKKQKPMGKRFDNQMTLHMWDGIALYNVKLFKNGKIQITGVKDREGAYKIVDELVKIIQIGQMSCPKMVSDIENLRNSDLSTRLINCDFRINYKINRPALHQLLVKKYKLVCTYEPCIYQGVKVSYFFNEQSPGGVCKCATRCTGKGPKTICKKVTVAAFQSGCVTITGAMTIDQIDFMYKLFGDILKNEAETVHQPTYEIAAT
jgi:TATA-box binding protein (TBP) (component of TFIID and TFIIIB)